MSARNVLAGIAKFSAVGVAFSIGEPNTISQLVLGVAGGVLTDGLNGICGRLVAPDRQNHDLQIAFVGAVEQAAREAAKGDILADFRRTLPHLYERFDAVEKEQLDAFQHDLNRAGRSWQAAKHITQGFSEAEIQQMAQLPGEAARDYATEIVRTRTLADLPEAFGRFFAERVRERVVFHFWERLKDPKEGTRPWRVYVRNSLQELHAALEAVAADQQAVLNHLKRRLSEPGIENWSSSMERWLAGFEAEWEVLQSFIEAQHVETRRHVTEAKKETQAHITAETEKILSRLGRTGIERPRQLPPQADVLEGREEELGTLIELLRTRDRVAIVGGGGVGKTALAGEALALLSPPTDPFQFYTGGILQHNFYKRRSLDALLDDWYLDFAEHPEQVPEPETARRIVLHGLKQLRPLVYLEGAENAEDLREVLDLLSQAGCPVLLTTRRKAQARGMASLEVETLAPDAAVRLYAFHAQLKTYETALENLCEQLGRLPLAIELVGRASVGLDPKDVADSYSFERLEEVSAAETGRRRIAAIVARALDQMDELGQRVFAALGWFANQPVPVDMLAAAVQADIRVVQRALQGLYDLSLVRVQPVQPYFHEQAPRWYCSHALVYEQARRRRAGQETFASYVVFVNRLVVGKENEGWQPAGYRTKSAVLPHVFHMVETAFDVLGADHPDTLLSVNNLAYLLQRTGRYAEAEPLYRRALEGRERVLGADHPDTLGSVNNLAALLDATGRYAEAEPLYRRALEGYERVLGADHPDTLVSMHNLGFFLVEQGRCPEGLPLLRQAAKTAPQRVGPTHPYTQAFQRNLEAAEKKCKDDAG